VDLTAAASTTLPFENLTTTKVLALNPAGTHLLSFDEARRALIPPHTMPRGRDGSDARCAPRRTAARCW
jgi:hypothetical protein